jgi:hypothetical protein
MACLLSHFFSIVHATSELKKTRIKKSGHDSNERYTSQWLYFDAFRFLEAAVNVRESTGSLLLQPGETSRSGMEPTEEEETSQVGVLYFFKNSHQSNCITAIIIFIS